jgi:Ca-activated chloride channel family protein
VIEARIDAGVPLEGVRSTSHAITSEPDGTAFRIRLDGAPVVADRDFVLRWRALRGDLPAGSVLIEDRDGDRYGLLMLVPPTPESGTGEGLPTETLFVIDVSGSMDGPSIRQARESLLKAIDRLRPGDTFNIMKFNEHTEALSESFLPARVPELDGARDWIRGLEAGGGTELLRALREGLRMLAEADPWPARRLVLITDGAVSNEEGTLREVRRDLGETRLHILGIGYAPNRHLVRRLAEIGRGTFDFVARAEEVGARTDSFLARIDRPVMTGLSIRWDGAPPEEIYPRTLPDLYAGEPLFVSLRLRASPAAARAVLTGHVAGGPLRLDVEVLPGAARGSGIATRWARAKVEDLMDGLSLGADEAAVRQEVVAVALGFDLVTRFTSLVAVEEFPSADGTWRTRHVPGALPDGSTLLDGSLPHGGTSGPLMVIVGLTLLMVGSFAAWLGRFER